MFAERYQEIHSSAKGVGRTRLSSRLALALALAAAVAVVFGRSVRFDFVNFDDPFHVAENPFVRSGISWTGIVWALRSYEGATWHPMTWVSLMLDAQIGGPLPWIFHLTNVTLHVANTVLLFLALEAMTGRRARCAIAAGVFALHPLRVESVAWISERKDVLSAFFWFAALLAYAAYARSAGPPSSSAFRACGATFRDPRMAVVLLMMAFGLMSKPMIVTLPITLLALDFWPLGRLGIGTEGAGARRRLVAAVGEKAPLLALSAAAGALAVVAQRSAGALGDLTDYPPGARAANAAVGAASYLGSLLWPTGLAIFYPHPGTSLPGTRIALAVTVLATCTVISVLSWRRMPFLLFGWTWYVSTLLPVSGLVQVGMQATADRYTYVPLIGIVVAMVWAAADLLAAASRRARLPLASGRAVGAAGVAILALLGGVAWRQLGHWRDSVTLFSHTLRVTGPNALARNCLGRAKLDLGRDGEAREQFEEALRIEPRYADARSNLAGVLARQGEIGPAMEQYREALRVNPDHILARSNLGRILLANGEIREASEHLAVSVARRPNHASTRAALGAALLRLGRPGEALPHLEVALRLDPSLVDARLDLGVALAGSGRIDDAARAFRDVLRRDPANAAASSYLEQVMRKGGAGS